jgi:outer membrane immunogenic protein
LFGRAGNKHEEIAGSIDPRLSTTINRGLNMKTILLAAAALVAIGGAAQAADMPLKAPPAPVACTMCDWSGFYIGGNAGAGIGMSRTTDTANFSAPGTLAAISPGIVNPVTADSLTRAPFGFVGGGQIGYNWQSAAWVFGLEADWQWSTQKDTYNHASFVASSTSSNFAQVTSVDEDKLSWLATGRARLGWASDSSLWYVTGGAAGARVANRYAFAATGAQPGGGVPLQAPGVGAQFGSDRLGWTAGFGVETSLSWFGIRAPNWSAKLEYLYVDLGSVTNTFTAPNANGSAFYTFTGQDHIRDNIVRLGVNYRFSSR